MPASNDVLRVLVVDDTVVYRRIMQNVVGEIQDASVVGVAANGRIALDRLEQLEVDIVLLDIEMPEMDGVETLRHIRQRWPAIGVVLVSGANRHSADLTMRALDLGALDFVPKADTGDPQRNHRQLVVQLNAIFRGFELRRNLGHGVAARSLPPVVARQRSARANSLSPTGNPLASTMNPPGKTEPLEFRSKLGTASGQKSGNSTGVGAVPREDKTSSADWRSVRPTGVVPAVVLIGCSTGGPQALAKVIPLLPPDLGVPVLIVQHMPPVFTASLAESLNRSSALRVCEASDGQLVEPNLVLLAPGGRHMTLRGERAKGVSRIALNDEPPVNSCRPSVDVLFRSAATFYAGCTLSVILTGMGEDGLDGVRALRAVGGRTLSQSADSCVVFGMPRAIELAGYSDEAVPIDGMAATITKWLRHASAPAQGLSTPEVRRPGVA